MLTPPSGFDWPWWQVAQLTLYGSPCGPLRLAGKMPVSEPMILLVDVAHHADAVISRAALRPAEVPGAERLAVVAIGAIDAERRS